ncbi:MAG: indolepyruvate oxidoreductase subunit beta [candidate division WOR-3 bacterium]
MDKKEFNIIICGVGGQGILLASEILALTAIESGFDVKKSEVHGMSQRGGSVFSHVRIGEKVYSPIIEKGKGDILLSLEKAETLRWVHYLKKDEPLIIMSDLEIIPPLVSLGITSYPKDVEKMLKDISSKLFIIPAKKISEEVKDIRVLNIFFLGFLSNFLPFDIKKWEEIIKSKVPENKLEINLNTFIKGKEFIKHFD